MSELPPLAFLDGAALSGGLVCVIAADLGLEDTFDRPTRLLFLGGHDPFQLQLPSNIVPVVPFHESDNQRIAALSKAGQVFVVDVASRRVTEERIPCSPLDELICLHVADGVVLACGMQGLVYARRDAARWTKCDAGLYDPAIKIPLDQPTGLVGTKMNDLYAVGCFGLMARYDGNVWTRIDGPTDRDLNQAITPPSGEIFICGNQGLILRGRDDGWELIDTGLDETFWGMAWFHEQLYLATLDNGLYTHDRRAGLKTVTTELVPSPTTYRLAADDGALWSLGLVDATVAPGPEFITPPQRACRKFDVKHKRMNFRRMRLCFTPALRIMMAASSVGNVVRY
jgi:hypothetical protein